MKTIFTCLFVSVALFGFGQQNMFKTRVFTSGEGFLYQLIELNDGSFISLGNNTGNSNGNYSGVYILKTDAHGIVLVSKELDSVNDNYSNGLIKTSDGGFAVCGNFDSKPGLVKLNTDLSIQWKKNYPIPNGDGAAFTVLQTPDNGYLLTGFASDSSESGTSGLLIKTDAQGQVLFSKRYFDYSSYSIYDAVATSDGNYALMASAVADTSAIHIIKIKPDGNVIWSKDFSNHQNEIEISSLLAASDGGLLITGETYIPDDDVQDYQMMLIKYSSAGNLLWSKTIVTQKDAECYGQSIAEDRDGGYVFCGELDTYNNNGDFDSSYGYVVKTDALGALKWTRTFNEANEGFPQFNKVITTSDGGYATSGEGSFINDGYGSILYKFNSDFQICGEIAGNEGTTRNFGSDISEILAPSNISVSSANMNATISDIKSTVDYVCTGALPLQLLSFNATLQNKSVNVNWQTANEINTAYFIVERSANGSSFTALQKIAATGNSSAIQTYSTNDLQPLQGTSYYRLQQVDKDGKTTYSSVVKVVVMSNGTIVISPNPVQSNIRIVVQSSANSNLTLQVMDMKGNVLAMQKSAVSEGRNEVNIPAASLAKGVYILKVMDKGSVQTIRFVKE